MNREPGDNNSVGIGMLAKGALPPKNRLSNQPKPQGEPSTPAYNISSKALDLIAHMNGHVSLPRI